MEYEIELMPPAEATLSSLPAWLQAHAEQYLSHARQ
jgi:hypothetical protein